MPDFYSDHKRFRTPYDSARSRSNESCRRLPLLLNWLVILSGCFVTFSSLSSFVRTGASITEIFSAIFFFLVFLPFSFSSPCTHLTAALHANRTIEDSLNLQLTIIHTTIWAGCKQYQCLHHRLYRHQLVLLDCRRYPE